MSETQPSQAAAPAADVLRDLLSAYRLTAKVFGHASYCGSWNLNTSGSRKCAFHVVAKGPCLLQTRDRPAVRLGAGDLVMFPRDAWHNLCAADDTEASITCGYFEFSEVGGNPILDVLPAMMLVRTDGQGERAPIAELVRLLVAEAEAQRPGGAFVLDRLAEALFAMVVRTHLESAEGKRGLLAALAEPRLARVLAAIHREPDHEWRLEGLARLANMSRTAFATAFAEAVGLPPMQYLAEWRMRRAAMLLKDPRNSVRGIAARLGYRSEAAFRRAFKRLQGFAPGALRREPKP